jgi:hypothetical protein
MKTFFSKYLYLFIWTIGIALIGAAFVFVVKENMNLLPSGRKAPAGNGQNGGAAQAAVPQAPSVSLTIQQSKTGNTLTVQWQHLPQNTTALNIFRGKTDSASSTWLLWKTISIPANQLDGGIQSIDLGKASLEGYSFYVQAMNENGGTAGNASSTSGSPILWTSSVTEPTTTSSTPSQPGSNGSGSNNGSGDQSGNNSQNPGNGSSTSSSTNPGQSSNNPPASGTSTTSGNGSPEPTGVPYYNPQVQISGYGSPHADNFWVEHVDQKIALGWQNLPTSTDNIVIYRAPNQDGPWTIVLSQNNPVVDGPYTFQVVDDTLGAPYFYKMNANEDGTTVASYGPTYLPAQ